MDIKLKLVKYQDCIDNLECNYMIINFKGSDINYVILNTIRRILLRYIPIYAFESKLTDINKNTSIFNNDMMKLRLNNLPIPLLNINKKFNMENIKKISDLEKNIYNKNDNDSIIMYINIKNTNKDILNVTTNNAVFKYFNNEIINSNELYKRPVLLCQLR